MSAPVRPGIVTTANGAPLPLAALAAGHGAAALSSGGTTSRHNVPGHGAFSHLTDAGLGELGS